MQKSGASSITEGRGQGSEGPTVGPEVEGDLYAVPEDSPLEYWSHTSRMFTSAACEKLGSRPEYPDPPDARDVVAPSQAGDPHESLPGSDEAPGLGAALDKLEKPCTPTPEEREQARETMQKRARAKYLTSDLLEELEDLDSRIPYSRARSCCRTVVQEDGELKCSYCKCRWCIVCNRIRMGKILNDYLPVLQMWEDEKGVFFVTLTAPNVEGEELRSELEEMKKKLRYCRRSIRETRGLDFRAIENWEVTYNQERKDYNPHVHVAVRGKKQAIALLEEWLKRWENASKGGQDMRKWDGTKGGMQELAKYATKMIAPDSEERPAAEVLDVIFRALYRLHLINPTGFEKEEEKARARRHGEGEQTDEGSTASPELDEQEEDPFEDLNAGVPAYVRPEEKCVWEWRGDDWFSLDTGEALAGCDPGG